MAASSSNYAEYPGSLRTPTAVAAFLPPSSTSSRPPSIDHRSSRAAFATVSLVRTKGFYINGILTDPKNVKENIISIVDIIKKDLTYEDGPPDLKFHPELYNDALNKEEAVKYGAYFLTVGTAIVFGVLPATVPIFVLALISSGAFVDQRKEDIAIQLADKITDHFKLNRVGRIALFAHSQGASIVEKAYNQLDRTSKQRIRIVTFGGVFSNPNFFAKKNVRDLVHPSDHFALGARFVFLRKMSTDSTHILEKPDDPQTLFAHGVEDYLKNDRDNVVKDSIHWAMEPVELRSSDVIPLHNPRLIPSRDPCPC